MITIFRWVIKEIIYIKGYIVTVEGVIWYIAMQIGLLNMSMIMFSCDIIVMKEICSEGDM